MTYNWLVLWYIMVHFERNYIHSSFNYCLWQHYTPGTHVSHSVITLSIADLKKDIAKTITQTITSFCLSLYVYFMSFPLSLRQVNYCITNYAFRKVILATLPLRNYICLTYDVTMELSRNCTLTFVELITNKQFWADSFHRNDILQIKLQWNI